MLFSVFAEAQIQMTDEVVSLHFIIATWVKGIRDDKKLCSVQSNI